VKLIKPDVSEMMVSTEEKMEFTAKLSPRTARQGKVTFMLHRGDREESIPGDGDFSVNFDTAGRYFKI